MTCHLHIGAHNKIHVGEVRLRSSECGRGLRSGQKIVVQEYEGSGVGCSLWAWLEG